MDRDDASRKKGLAAARHSCFITAMTRVFQFLSSLLLSLSVALPGAVWAQTPENDGEAPATHPATVQPMPYDSRLVRLSEIVGSVHYLRTLCRDPQGDSWRQTMQVLIDREAGGEPERKAALTAAFNRGYRSFASVYTACTPQAVTADVRYRAEGATLASEIVARFGN